MATTGSSRCAAAARSFTLLPLCVLLVSCAVWAAGQISKSSTTIHGYANANAAFLVIFHRLLPFPLFPLLLLLLLRT
jgi:hypothetical protein